MKINPGSKAPQWKTIKAPNKLHCHAPNLKPKPPIYDMKEREKTTVLYTSGIPWAPDTTLHASLGLLALGTTLPEANMAPS